MASFKTPFLPLVTVAAAQGANDALTDLANFESIPKNGIIMSCSVIDLGRATGINCDVYLSQHTFTPTTINDAFDPSDTDILNCVGMILVDTWKAFADSCFGVVDNVGLPYYAPEGKLYLQLITRGTPTPASTADMFISLGIAW
jgi:hypothetical protein